MIKVVGFCGSPRKDGNTSAMIDLVLNDLQKENIETEKVHLNMLYGCRSCWTCKKTKNKKCIFGESDGLNEYIDKILKADGIILGTPVYCADASANMRAFIERIALVSKMNDDMFKGKIGAGIVAVRRGGALNAFNSLNTFFTILQMPIVSSSYWNFCFGYEKGEIHNDIEGIETMKNLATNMAYMLRKM